MSGFFSLLFLDPETMFFIIFLRNFGLEENTYSVIFFEENLELKLRQMLVLNMIETTCEFLNSFQ